jgi:hypothetical protein
VTDDYERRKQQRLRKLGTQTPQCVVCGGTHWEYLELHHVEGQAFGETLVILCRNCHRRLSDSQLEHPVLEAGADTDLTSIARLLHGFADLLLLVVEKLRDMATTILTHAQPQKGA